MEIAREIVAQIDDSLNTFLLQTEIVESVRVVAAAIEKDRAETDSALDDLLARYPASITEWADAIRTIRSLSTPPRAEP